jgi:hypothetical protein
MSHYSSSNHRILMHQIKNGGTLMSDFDSLKPPKDDKKDDKKEDNVVFKHDKDGLSIYITIYNTNNNANEGSEAGLNQRASEGGQISGKEGQNANLGGQIAEKCGQNANQDGEVKSENCGSELEENDSKKPYPDKPHPDKPYPDKPYPDKPYPDKPYNC